MAKSRIAQKSITRKSKSIKLVKDVAYAPIQFGKVEKKALEFANHIQRNLDKITDILLDYESYEVTKDETGRALDLLENLRENKEYFKLRIGPVAAFLPRNQPLYAFTCFVVVPSLMASEVHFRIPKSMQDFFPELLAVLKAKVFFPNVFATIEQHQSFLRRHSALKMNPHTDKTIPATDVVIFTGTSTRADQLRSIFDSRTLFITNGSGHNPVVVSRDADVNAAVDAVLCLQLYNQGQDCAAPNAILVHREIYDKFCNRLQEKLPSYKIGHYKDKSARIGPIGDPLDLVGIEDFLVEHRKFIDPFTPGIIRSFDAIIEPTIIHKPLKTGGNFTETFAPIIFIQKYDSDDDLGLYFDDPSYPKNAMYMTIYGTSQYAKSLIGKRINGKLLHDKSTVLFNTHLHAPGVERGTKPYGGYGYGGSNLWIRGKGISKPTLPQRDIYEHVARPIKKRKSLIQYRKEVSKYTVIREKNIEKLLRIGNTAVAKNEIEGNPIYYFDLGTVTLNDIKSRFIKVDLSKAHQLLSRPNIQYFSNLAPQDVVHIQKLKKLLGNKPNLEEEFRNMLYSTVGEKTSGMERQELQRTFFGHLYQLLFGKKSGPRLTTFLWEIDSKKICELLDI